MPERLDTGHRVSQGRMQAAAKTFSFYLFPLLAVLVLWEIISRIEIVNPRLFPPPSAIWLAFLEWYGSGEFWRDVNASYGRMLAGFFAGGLAGIGVGLFTGRSRPARACLAPIIQFLRPLPPVAIIPLVIVWLGIGNVAKIFSIGFAVFFPVWINTHLGASAISTTYLWSARMLCRSRVRIGLKVILPGTLPSIIAGLRTSIAIAFIMVYVAEIAGASAGIGYQISVCHLAYRIDKMIAALAVLAAAGAFADFAFAIAMRIIFPWTKNAES